MTDGQQGETLIKQLRNAADFDEREGGFAYILLRGAAKQLEATNRKIAELTEQLKEASDELQEHGKCAAALEERLRVVAGISNGD